MPRFFVWLDEQIKLGDHRFILGAIQKESNKPEKIPQKKIIFLLIELLEQYSDYSGVSIFTIHEALRQALSIDYCYTIERDELIVEVAPCLYPLHYNLGNDL